MTTVIPAFIAGAAIAALVVWLAMRSRSAVFQERLVLLQKERDGLSFDAKRLNDMSSDLRSQLAEARAQVAHEKKLAEEKLALLNDATHKLSDAFAALSAQALKSNNQAFLELATTKFESLQGQAEGELDKRQTAVAALLEPIKDSLGRVDTELRGLEEKRLEAYARLTEQVQALATTQEALQSETGNLVKALRSPVVRGRWGEIQLHRVVEIAEMLPYCDFVEQQTVETEEGRLRPDLIVKLPGGKNIVVDAKTPLQGYLDACETEDPDRQRACLSDHARQVRDHFSKLGSKSYWDQFQPSPEFVVMFLPGETFFSSALQADPGLIEQGVAQRVIPASPTTLIALLRAVAYGWQQERIAENAQRISNLGRDLYERVRTMAEHFQAMGKGLERAVESYNKAVGSAEGRVLVAARRFKELGTNVQEQIPELAPLDITPRRLDPDDWQDAQASMLPEVDSAHPKEH